MSISTQERADVEAMLAFWFGEPNSDEFGKNRDQWWVQSDSFDGHIRTYMLPYHERAVTGGLDHWVFDCRAGLALIILLDQVPRNMFRGTAEAFASDSKARLVAGRFIDLGLDSLLAHVQRLFVYLPFEHSENMGDQNDSVALMSGLDVPCVAHSAYLHRDIVDRFGRFPHRNDILQRASTPEEIDFLRQPNSSF